jgi:hypothetical protein
VILDFIRIRQIMHCITKQRSYFYEDIHDCSVPLNMIEMAENLWALTDLHTDLTKVRITVLNK